jgi:rubrerythrin
VQTAYTSEALEFLCVAEGGEVTHYEVLDAMVKDAKDTEFADKVKSILNEEKEHLQEQCIKLSRENIKYYLILLNLLCHCIGKL